MICSKSSFLDVYKDGAVLNGLKSAWCFIAAMVTSEFSVIILQL